MSLYVKATCGNCKCKFEIYSITLQHEESFRCPHCNAKIEKKQWSKLVNAFFTMNDLNYQIRKSHGERGIDFFSFECVNKEVPREKIKGE